MKSFFFIVFLFSGSIIFAQNSSFQQSNNIKLNEAFKIQEHNCQLIEQLLIANLSNLKKAAKTTEPVKSTFYKELCELYKNFKTANNNFDISGLIPEDNESIQNFYNVKLAKIDSLYKLRDTSIPINVITENTTDILKNGQISKEILDTYKEPMYEDCKDLNLTSGESCVSYLFRKFTSRSYRIPEFRFTEQGVQVKLYMQLILNRNGEIKPTHIIRSSNYFEFDMEAISVVNKFSEKYKFTPAMSGNRVVRVMYACPVIISVVGTN
jgi:hypothetical protein